VYPLTVAITKFYDKYFPYVEIAKPNYKQQSDVIQENLEIVENEDDTVLPLQRPRIMKNLLECIRIQEQIELDHITITIKLEQEVKDLKEELKQIKDSNNSSNLKCKN
jgi:hypothetical protein